MNIDKYFELASQTDFKVFVFLFKRAEFQKVFFDLVNWNNIATTLDEIQSLSNEKLSINTFQTNNKATRWLSFGKMDYSKVTKDLWLTKYKDSDNWKHYHTDFWLPNKTSCLKNYELPELVICIDGNVSENESSTDFYNKTFSIIIYKNSKHISYIEKIVELIKEMSNDFRFYHFINPWLKIDSEYVYENGTKSRSIAYQLADVDGAIRAHFCIDYFESFEWKNHYCKENELIR